MQGTLLQKPNNHQKNDYVSRTAFLAFLPALFLLLFIGYLLILYPELEPQRRVSSLSFTVLFLALGIFVISRLALRNFFDKQIRLIYERIILAILFFASLIATFTTVGIVLSLIFEAFEFFKYVPLSDFLFGAKWNPQSAFHYQENVAGEDFQFGALPVIYGTLMITLFAVSFAVLIGLSSAIYLSEYASSKSRAFFKPLLEILAGIPTVVYGFFAALTVAPLLKDSANFLGIPASAESALAAGLVMGVMLIPFISSLSDDVFHAIPNSLREASLAMGATQGETMVRVLIPAAMPGLIGAILLAISRAIGETMIVVMAAGLAAKFTLNPLESVTTATVQIVTLLVGDQEFDSPKTLAAFALGLLLFVLTLSLNIVALLIRKKFTKVYS